MERLIEVLLFVVVGPSTLMVLLCVAEWLLFGRSDDRLAVGLAGEQLAAQAEEYSNDLWHIRQWSTWRDEISAAEVSP